MKKFLIWICMLACIFGLTACGSEETLTEYEQRKVYQAQQLAYAIVPFLQSFMFEEEDIFAEYTAAEVEDQVKTYQYMVYNQVVFGVDGNAIRSAVKSFQTAADSVGNIQQYGATSAKIDGKTIIVEMEIIGDKKEATAELIFSNDMFYVLESASLNPKSSMGELMTGAAMNTLIGMGTVFAVLILISCIIACFRIIPVLQKKAADRKSAKTAEKQTAVAEGAVAQIMEQEEVLGDDLELTAVIAAAIAAFEGSASTDGFVVRSIIRR